jgi:hypothetical protein
VLDLYSRRVLGCSIDASQTAVLITNALGMPSTRASSAGTRPATSTRAARITQEMDQGRGPTSRSW